MTNSKPAQHTGRIWHLPLRPIPFDGTEGMRMSRVNGRLVDHDLERCHCTNPNTCPHT